MNTIVKNIILYSGSNELNITMSQSAIDYLFVGKRSLKRLSFRLTDKMNNITNLYGNSVYFLSYLWINKKQSFFIINHIKQNMKYFVLDHE